MSKEDIARFQSDEGKGELRSWVETTISPGPTTAVIVSHLQIMWPKGKPEALLSMEQMGQLNEPINDLVKSLNRVGLWMDRLRKAGMVRG